METINPAEDAQVIIDSKIDALDKEVEALMKVEEVKPPNEPQTETKKHEIIVKQDGRF